MPALHGVLGIDIGRRSVTGGAATPQRSLYAVPQPKAGTHVRGTLPRRHLDRDVAPDHRTPGAIEAIFSIEVGTPSRPHPPFSAVPQRWPGSTDAKATICLRLRQQQVAESKA